TAKTSDRSPTRRWARAIRRGARCRAERWIEALEGVDAEVGAEPALAEHRVGVQVDAEVDGDAADRRRVPQADASSVAQGEVGDEAARLQPDVARVVEEGELGGRGDR